MGPEYSKCHSGVKQSQVSDSWLTATALLHGLKTANPGLVRQAYFAYTVDLAEEGRQKDGSEGKYSSGRHSKMIDPAVGLIEQKAREHPFYMSTLGEKHNEAFSLVGNCNSLGAAQGD